MWTMKHQNYEVITDLDWLVDHRHRKQS